jgi:hypothetical protein
MNKALPQLASPYRFDRRCFNLTVPLMKILRTCIVVLLLFAFATSLFATDFGDASEVKQVRKIVAGKFGHALHVSVSNDWALCTAYSGESDISVVLHRSSSDWKIVTSDGGAYVAETLKPLGVPAADIPALLKAYQ